MLADLHTFNQETAPSDGALIMFKIVIKAASALMAVAAMRDELRLDPNTRIRALLGHYITGDNDHHDATVILSEGLTVVQTSEFSSWYDGLPCSVRASFSHESSTNEETGQMELLVRCLRVSVTLRHLEVEFPFEVFKAMVNDIAWNPLKMPQGIDKIRSLWKLS